MDNFGTFVLVAAKSLLIHVLVGAVAFAIAWYLSSTFDDATQTLRSQFEDSPDPLTSVMLTLELARWKVVQWILVGFTASWIASTFFLVRAEKHPARREEEGAQQLVTWLVMCAAAMLCTGLAWYTNLSLEQVAAVIASQNYMITVASGFVLAALAYWLSTGLSVKSVMRPSVPLSGLLPRFWNS